MDCHAENKIKDVFHRMSTDGSVFSKIEERWPKFKEGSHNIRLSLEVDGVNPFGELISTYSVWPIFVINNNIPLWMSKKREHIMLIVILRGIYVEYFFFTMVHLICLLCFINMSYIWWLYICVCVSCNYV